MCRSWTREGTEEKWPISNRVLDRMTIEGHYSLIYVCWWREKQSIIVFSFLSFPSRSRSVPLLIWLNIDHKMNREKESLSSPFVHHSLFLSFLPSLRSTSPPLSLSRTHACVVWQQKSYINYIPFLFSFLRSRIILGIASTWPLLAPSLFRRIVALLHVRRRASFLSFTAGHRQSSTENKKNQWWILHTRPAEWSMPQGQRGLSVISSSISFPLFDLWSAVHNLDLVNTLHVRVSWENKTSCIIEAEYQSLMDEWTNCSVE